MWAAIKSNPKSKNVMLVEFDNSYLTAEEAYYNEVKKKNGRVVAIKFKNGKLVVLPKEVVNGSKTNDVV